MRSSPAVQLLISAGRPFYRAVRTAGWRAWCATTPKRSKKKGSTGPIVALTTHPGRGGLVEWTLRSLLRQNQPPSQIFLVLSEIQYERGEESLPLRVKKLIRSSSGAIRVVTDPADIGSFKKLLPVRSLFPGEIIVTVDDDVIYPPGWLGALVSEHKKSPSAVVGARGRLAVCTDGVVAPYREWKYVTSRLQDDRVVLTGRGGILYPPGSLDPRAQDRDAATNLAANADDLWFKLMALRAGTATICIPSKRDFPASEWGRGHGLYEHNVAGGRNDAVIRALMHLLYEDESGGRNRD